MLGLRQKFGARRKVFSMARNYLLYDVFTNERLAGNPLAVVLDCQGLDTVAMQAIAREFNLSETVFVFPPDNSKHRNRIRIFTPDYEMPFAGHPTVGSAIALAAIFLGTTISNAIGSAGNCIDDPQNECGATVAP